MVPRSGRKKPKPPDERTRFCGRAANGTDESTEKGEKERKLLEKFGNLHKKRGEARDSPTPCKRFLNLEKGKEEQQKRFPGLYLHGREILRVAGTECVPISCHFGGVGGPSGNMVTIGTTSNIIILTPNKKEFLRTRNYLD